MKKIGWVLIFFCFLLGSYDFFLVKYPLKKTFFYTNEERTEGYIYEKGKYSIVIAGSSLSGAFEGTQNLFSDRYFNMCLPNTGACTAIEVLKKSHKIPQTLYVEINHIDRGLDSVLINEMFAEPLHSLKYYMPFLLKQNHLLPNIIDRVKHANNYELNDQRPPAVLYNVLLANEQKRWSSVDTLKVKTYFGLLEQALTGFSKRGCKIVFFEVPMDNSLYHSKLLTFERKQAEDMVARAGYKFIKSDSSRYYKTGDGVHILKMDANVYVKYFKTQTDKL